MNTPKNVSLRLQKVKRFRLWRLMMVCLFNFYSNSFSFHPFSLLFRINLLLRISIVQVMGITDGTSSQTFHCHFAFILLLCFVLDILSIP